MMTSGYKDTLYQRPISNANQSATHLFFFYLTALYKSAGSTSVYLGFEKSGSSVKKIMHPQGLDQTLFKQNFTHCNLASLAWSTT